ncbi:MAG: deoxyribodipyrimidine photolyase, partial [Rhodobacteraceae bacterium]|nr:deoxyribodipyrimidine photolyase [Paracoccaceae bacterium]
MQKTHVVWFKRDLRLHDNAAFSEAAKRGCVLPLYIFEPDLWAQPDMSGRQYAFLIECLEELNADLTRFGKHLVVRVGHAPSILSDLHLETGFKSLWSHQETWNAWTYERDKEVSHFCATHNIKWMEPRQFGVIRNMPTRTGWAKQWDRQMATPQRTAPTNFQTVLTNSDKIPSAKALGLTPDPCSQ